MNFIKTQHQAKKKSECTFLGDRKKEYAVCGPINLEGTEFLKCNQVSKTSENFTYKNINKLHHDIRKRYGLTDHM